MDTVRGQLKAVDANAPLISVKAFRSQHESSASVWLLNAAARLFGSLGIAAALVAAVGLYGVKSYVMSRRTREFGVRMAVGASPREIIGMAMREAATSTAIGVEICLGLGVAMGFGANQILYLIRPTDPASLLGATAILAGTALVATIVPAWRASKISPMTALRDN